MVRRLLREGMPILAACVIAAVWGGCAFLTASISASHEREALAGAENVIRGFAQSTTQAVRDIDNTLRAVARDHARGGERSVREFVGQGLYDHTVIHHIALFDAQGRLTYHSLGSDLPLNAATQPFFRAARDAAGDRLFIDVPLKTGPVPVPLIRMSRPLLADDGQFEGAVVAAVDPRYFVALYRSANVGRHGSVSLIGLDRVIRARGSPDGDPALGRLLDRARLWDELKLAPSGLYWVSLQSDGLERAYAYRQLDGYPLVVTVGVARVDMEAAVADVQRNVLILAMLLTAAVLAAAVFFQAQRRAAERLHGALRLNRDFLARVSHELRTPLNAIIGFSEVIKGQLLGPDATARYAEYAEDIHASGQQLLVLVNDILDLSSLQAGKVALEIQPVDLTAAIEWAIRVVAPQAEAKRLSLDMSMAPGLARLAADPRAVRQMLLNLLSNAVKFTPEGGRILVSALKGPGGRCVLRVADSGIGMTADEVAQAVVPFGQTSALTARAGQGHGLGLAIVKTLIEAHGGRLAIDSSPGEGSRVTLEFAA